MKAFALLLATGFLLSSFGEARADDAKVDALVAAADSLEKSGDTAGAITKLDEAFRDTPRPDVAGKLGLLEQHSGEYAASAQHLELAMRFFPEKGRPDDRQRLIDAFTDVRGKVAAIRFRVKPDAERVTIDGKALTLTTLDYDVFVMPGTRRIAVPGRDDVTIDAVANQSYPIDASSLPKVAIGPRYIVSKSRRPVWPLVVGGVLAAGGIAVGIGMTVVASKKETDAKDIAKSSACSGAQPSARCVANGYRATNDHNTFQAVGIAGFVGGGALIVGTLVYALAGDSHPKDPDKVAGSKPRIVSVTPDFADRYGALSVEGTF